MPVSKKQSEYRDKYDKENFQYITFKARKGAKERIVQAATATGQSTNGFIRAALDKAVQDATGVAMEPLQDERDNAAVQDEALTTRVYKAGANGMIDTEERI